MRDLHEVDKDVLERVTVVPVDAVEEVLDRALLPSDSGARRDRRVGFTVPASTPPVLA
jgi:hypothetical protein